MVNWEECPKYDQELLRLVSVGSYTQKEIAERMTDKFKEPFTRNSVKSRLHLIGEKGYRARPTAQPITIKRREATKTEIAQDARKLIHTLKGELDRAAPYPKARHPKRSKGDTLVIHLTDWHVGKIIKDESGNIVYDESVFQKRIDRLLSEMLTLLDAYIKKGTPIEDVVVISTGDIVDGQGIFSTQAISLEISPPFQVMLAVKVIQRLFLSLLDRGLKVRFKGAKGNHGEIRVSGKSIDPLANWDLMVYLILDYWARNMSSKNVTIEYSELDYLNFEIQGWKYHIRHIAPVQPETAAGKAKFLGWKDTHGFNALVYGHYHHWAVFDKGTIPIFRGGSLTGADEFSETLAEKSDPVQLIWGANRKRPLTFFYPVDLGKKGNR